MLEQLLNLLLAAFGLGFLIFVHEWGHYIAAKKCKMSVEVFSIGFGKPLKTWISKSGVKWQIGTLPFGGYVKIRDLDSSDPNFANLENRPLAKIVVSVAGPVANLILCFLLFSLIWSFGGRFKMFYEVTPTVSYVDAKGRFAEAGMLPGDTIEKISGHPYHDVSEFLLYQIAGSGDIKINRFNFHDQTFSPVGLHIPPHNPPLTGSSGFHAEVIPAQFVIVAEDKGTLGADERIIWANGAPVFSGASLSLLFNDHKAFFSIQRKGEIFTTRLPLLHIKDLRLSASEKTGLEDWAAEKDLSFQSLQMIPYLFNSHGIITSPLVFIAPDTSEKVFKFDPKDPFSLPLEVGDRIVMVNGHPFEKGAMALSMLQKKEATVITQKSVWNDKQTLLNAEEIFWSPWQSKEFASLMTTRNMEQGSHGTFQVYTGLPLKELDGADPEKKRLGLEIQRKDAMVLYNPAPWTLFGECLMQSGRTLYFLISGGLSPSMLSGPIGIVKSMHTSLERSWREAIYWIGFISLSLAFFNLLPIPVLDGGMILFFLYELVTGKRVSPKTMQRFIIPAVILLIAFMIYVTYSDVLRLF